MRTRTETRWWRTEEHNLLPVLRAALDDVYKTSDSRLWSYDRAARLFAEKLEVVIGRNLASPARLDFNLVSTLALTATSHLKEYASPRGEIYTEGASWEERRDGRALNKWLDAAVLSSGMEEQVRDLAAVR